MNHAVSVGALVFVVALATSCACGGGFIFDLHNVEFRVWDSNCDIADVTWKNGDLTRQGSVDLPWSETDITANATVQILAQRGCDGPGTITAEIHVEGELVAQNSADGPHAVATASTWVD